MVLGPLNERVDAIKDVSLIKDVYVFYAESSNTKHRCLVSDVPSFSSIF